MRDVLPDSLISQLLELRLCQPADVQRARRLVRKMTRDLPVFDSIWIDALAQLQAITPFQARVLEDNPPEALRAGEFVLRNQLGERTFLATGPDRRSVVLKRIALPVNEITSLSLRLELLVERARNIASPHLAVPVQFVPTPAAVFLASRFVPGNDLQGLLIRRGRFPADIVGHIADHLLVALATCHAAGLTHGDLRLSKIRVTPRGQITLVEAGVQPAVSPELMVHTLQSPDLAETVAPERIGTNQPATAASDLYAAGCVLWHLLAGRAPHQPADPLAKLAAHQTKRIPDVREFAPETLPALATLIQQLTSPLPEERPRSAETARRQLGLRSVPRARQLARFRRQFDAAIPHLAARPARGGRRWTPVVAALLLLGTITMGLSDRGLRTQLLSIAARIQKPATDEPGLQEADSEFLDLPAADARGVITLTKTGPYAATEITAVGTLVVEAGKGIRPRIVIDKDSWLLVAQQVVLKNLDIDAAALASDAAMDALVSLQSQRFQVEGCRFVGPTGNRPSAASAQLTAISWSAADRRDPQAGVLRVEDSVFVGSIDAVSCGTAPRRIRWENVLKTGAGSALTVKDARTDFDLKLSLERVTLRNSGPLLSCAGSLVEEVSAAGIEIEAASCVFEITPQASLVELLGTQIRPDWPQAVRLTGDGSLIRSETALLAHMELKSGSTTPLESDDLQFEGLFIDDFEFKGPDTTSARDSMLAKTHAPRRQRDELPGIDHARLPQ